MARRTRRAGEARGNPRRRRRVRGARRGNLGSCCSEFTAAGIGGWVEGARCLVWW
jgi:hypothetical protein